MKRFVWWDPPDMEWMAGQFPQGCYLYFPASSHLAMHDDPEIYFGGLIRFVRDVESGTFTP